MSDTPQTGIFDDVPFDEYRQWPSLNKSNLWVAHLKTLAHYKYEIAHTKVSDSLVIGQAVHAAVLEPEFFDDRYVVGGPVNPRTEKVYGTETKKFAEWKAEQTKPVLTTEQYDFSCRLRDAVWANKAAAMLLKNARTEVSARWHDEQTVLMCKGRPDAINQGILIDLKTCRNASPDVFGRAGYKYGYHFQMAFYLDGLRQVSETAIDKAVIIAVEKEPPYLCAVYELDKDTLDLGRYQYRVVLQMVKGAMERNEWPGYDDDIMSYVLPSYAGQELSGAQF